MTAEADAQLLRRAADLVAQAAGCATPGPWVPKPRPYSHPNVAWHIAAPNLRDSARDGVCHTNEGDAAWIALCAPHLAPTLVQVFRGAARDAEEVGPDWQVVALARALLGEGEQP